MPIKTARAMFKTMEQRIRFALCRMIDQDWAAWKRGLYPCFRRLDRPRFVARVNADRSAGGAACLWKKSGLDQVSAVRLPEQRNAFCAVISEHSRLDRPSWPGERRKFFWDGLRIGWRTDAMPHQDDYALELKAWHVRSGFDGRSAAKER